MKAKKMAAGSQKIIPSAARRFRAQGSMWGTGKHVAHSIGSSQPLVNDGQSDVLYEIQG